MQRHPGNKPIGQLETNILDYDDEVYGKEYYEDDFYNDEVDMLRQQLDQILPHQVQEA